MKEILLWADWLIFSDHFGYLNPPQKELEVYSVLSTYIGRLLGDDKNCKKLDVLFPKTCTVDCGIWYWKTNIQETTYHHLYVRYCENISRRGQSYGNRKCKINWKSLGILPLKVDRPNSHNIFNNKEISNMVRSLADQDKLHFLFLLIYNKIIVV